MGLLRPLHWLSDRTRRGSRILSRLGHRRHLPTVTRSYDRGILSDLNRCGVAVTCLEKMVQEEYVGCSELLIAGRTLFNDDTHQLSGEGSKQYIRVAQLDDVLSHPEIIFWGLQERLLAIAENYIGLPVAYRGVTARRDLANGQQLETRHWHCDGEDLRILKIIVYLSDVGPDDGPFCYMPKGLRPRYGLPTSDGGRISDDVLQQGVPPDNRIACVGPAGTVLFADTCSLWHRGAVGTDRDRFTLFFSYNSQLPLSPADCRPILPMDGLHAVTLMTARQRAAIDFAY